MNRLCGIGEPVTLRNLQGKIDYKTSLTLIRNLGAKSFREWGHITDILHNPTTPKPEVVAAYKKTFEMAKEYDLEITLMNHTWFMADEYSGMNGFPRRDRTNKNYADMLDKLEQSYETLAQLFPEIQLWQLGNEPNHNPFMHSPDYYQNKMQEKYTFKEKADIITDMMYVSAKAIKKHIPNAKMIMASPAPILENGEINILGIKDFLELVYLNIVSGNFPSTNPDDYFDMLAWHPYIWDREPDERWVKDNIDIFSVAEKYGDKHKKVIFTEFGYTDKGDAEKANKIKDYNIKALEVAEKNLPFVHAIHIFRLFQFMNAMDVNKTDDWGGAEEAYYGLFSEPENGLKPMEKAISYHKYTKSTFDLMQNINTTY